MNEPEQSAVDCAIEALYFWERDTRDDFPKYTGQDVDALIDDLNVPGEFVDRVCDRVDGVAAIITGHAPKLDVEAIVLRLINNSSLRYLVGRYCSVPETYTVDAKNFLVKTIVADLTAHLKGGAS